MRNELFGRAALVSGATSGIGSAAAMALAKAGATIVGIGRDRERGSQNILVNGAGVYLPDSADPQDQTWRRTMAVNVDGVFYLSRAAVDAMKARGGGAIVNIASTFGLVGWPGYVAYCASKGAVIQMTRAMAVGHAGDGIRVNALCPGSVETPMIISDSERSKPGYHDLLREISKAVPQGRIATAEEVANFVAFLCSDLSAHVTGAVIPIDGGYTAV